MTKAFSFQQFRIEQNVSAMKVGTDGILLGAWANQPNPKRALDIGTGTGLIALMLAQRYPHVQIDAVEIDTASADEAARNITESPFKSRVEVHSVAIQDYAKSVEPATYDLIVSNPPFFTGGVLAEQEGRAKVRHTIKLSHQDLLRAVQRLLKSTGSFCMVLPWLEGLRFIELAATYQLYACERVAVSGRPGANPNRLLLRFAKVKAAYVQTEISIYAAASGQARSADFQMLTAAFYLKD